MRTETIICNSLGADGRPCGATAVVHEVHYRFEPVPEWVSGVDRVLTEVVTDVECPRCGYRSQREAIVPADVLGR